MGLAMQGRHRKKRQTNFWSMLLESGYRFRAI